MPGPAIPDATRGRPERVRLGPDIQMIEVVNMNVVMLQHTGVGFRGADEINFVPALGQGPRGGYRDLGGSAIDVAVIADNRHPHRSFSRSPHPDRRPEPACELRNAGPH